MNGKRTAVIFAGGRSSRFGSNKVFARIERLSLIERTIASCEAARCMVFLSGPANLLDRYGYPVIEDRNPFEGPLAALAGALERIDADHLLALACDMPLPSPTLIDELWKMRMHADIVWYRSPTEASPLPGLYARTALATMKTLLQEKKRSLRCLAETDRSLHEIVLKKSFWNINTPSDLKEYIHELRSPTSAC